MECTDWAQWRVMEDISGAEAGRCFALTQQPYEAAVTAAGSSPGVNHSLLERVACHVKLPLRGLILLFPLSLHPARASLDGVSSPFPPERPIKGVQ